MAALSFLFRNIFSEKYNHNFVTSFQKLLLIYLILSLIYAFPHNNCLVISNLALKVKNRSE